MPVLWDKQRGTIVSNESPRSSACSTRPSTASGATPGDYYPEPLRAEIDAINARIYDTVNNGVYKAGFATTQEAYEEAVGAAVRDARLARGAPVARAATCCGDAPTEADWRLFTTLVRFDAVYVGHFKCNLRRLVDYPSLWAYTRDLYQWPGVARDGELRPHQAALLQEPPTINPTGIVPVGPVLDFDAPPGRETLAA